MLTEKPMPKPKTKGDRPYAIRFTEPSMAKQSFREHADINKIMERHAKTGVAPVNRTQGTYQDNPNISYHEAMQVIVESQEAFESQPAAIRNYFKNDPALMLEFLHNEENREEAIRLGLIEPMVAEAQETAQEPPKDQSAPQATPSPENAPAGPE